VAVRPQLSVTVQTRVILDPDEQSPGVTVMEGTIAEEDGVVHTRFEVTVGTAGIELEQLMLA